MRSTGGTSGSRRDGTALAFTPGQPVPGVRQRALSRSATRPILSHNRMEIARYIARAKAKRNKKAPGDSHECLGAAFVCSMGLCGARFKILYRTRQGK